MTRVNRRTFVSSAAAVTASALVPKLAGAAEKPAFRGRPKDEPFGYCFNTSTVRGQKLDFKQQVELVIAAGYEAIEPWMRDIQAYQQAGGNLADIKKQLTDANVTVESAIGFARWIVDDPKERAKGLEDAKRDMGLLQKIGGKRIAAPPVGATNQTDLDLLAAAKRYHKLLELGREMGITPQVELWGFSKSLSRLGELMFVAVESGHPDACLLPDVYHIYKGGSDFHGLKLINGRRIHVFHVNDYPAQPPRETIGDADRVYPGDGVAPLKQIFGDMYAAGFRGMLSLELFNRDYWKQDALKVARTGLAKTRQAVRRAFADQ
jgi:sugar phosphate isomerase/epimerase